MCLVLINSSGGESVFLSDGGTGGLVDEISPNLDAIRRKSVLDTNTTAAPPRANQMNIQTRSQLIQDHKINLSLKRL